jgi:replicative superfamily II helicase
LLEYVTQRVIDAAAQLGKPQHPTLRGQIDGEFLVPVFKPGVLFKAAFPERLHCEISSNIHSLEAYGFPPALLQAWAGIIPSLNELQLAALNEFKLLEGEHLVVSAPTSSGKTMIGELAAIRGALERKRALFLHPLKALVSDKLKSFNETYGGFGITTIVATGETDDITPLLRGQYDIGLLTYEKFAAVALSNPHILDQVSTIVIDEVQMIADESRGINLEFILTLLRMRRRQGIEPQVIALSAVIGDTSGLERWLGARLLRRNQRPVPLDEGILLANGQFRFIDGDSSEEKITEPLIQPQIGKGSSQDWVIPLVRKLVNEGQQVIVFREKKGEARGCALYLARELGLLPAKAALDALPRGDTSRPSEDLQIALQGGVAFHTSELAPEERQAIEEQFRADNTNLRVIAATTTLAMGINTPASAVVIVGLNHPLPNGTLKPYSVAEYKNLAGRAGRLRYAERGTSYLLALNPHQEHYLWTQYVQGVPENLCSRFLSTETDPRSLIVRVLVVVQQISKQGISAEDIIEFLEASFGAFQQMQYSQQWKWNNFQLLEALQDLLNHKLIERDNNNHYYLTPLGKLAGEAGVEVESIIRLVECLKSLNPKSIHESTLLTATQLTAELDQVLFPINKRSTNKEPMAWKQELQGQGVPPTLLNALHYRTFNKHQGTLRAKKAVACLLFVTQRNTAEIEDCLTRFGGASDGAAGAIRAVASRTCDLLPTVAQVAVLLHPTLDLEDRLSRLLVRLNVGVPAIAVDLARQAGSRLTRGDYLQLLKAGLCSIDAIEASSDMVLLSYLGDDEAKLAVVRKAVEIHRQQELESILPSTMLEPFES